MKGADGDAGPTARLTSIVLPVHNETENIQPVLRALWAALKNHPHEILVCYDFDEDATLPAIRAMVDCPSTVRLVKNDLRRGVVWAIQAGFQAAHGDVVITTMADLSDPPEVIPAMAERVRAGAAVVSASRYMKGGSQTGGPLLKRTLSRCAGWSLHWLAGMGTHDATTNFRAYSADFLRQVKIESTHGFEIGLELTVKAHLMGLKVDEVPSSWRDRAAGRSRFRLWAWLPAYLHWYIKAVWKPLAWACAGSFSLIWLLALSRPLLQPIATANLDSSWVLTLHEAFARNMRMGDGLAFTFGPWGFTFVPIGHPATFMISMIVIALWGCSLFWGAWRIARGSFGNPLWACLWLLCLFRVGTASTEDLAFLALVSLTMAYFHFQKTARAGALMTGVLGALAALAVLSKFTTGIAGLFCVAIVAADLCSRKRWPWPLLTFAAALPLLWIAAGQRLSDLGGFFRCSWEITSGYTEAMSLPGDPSAWVWYCVTAALLLGVAAAVELRLHRRRGLLPLAVIALALFLKFKHGFVRNDAWHVFFAMAALTSLVFLLAPFAWFQLKQGRRKWIVAAACILAFISFPDQPGSSQAAATPPLLAYLAGAPRLAADSLSGFAQLILHPGGIARDHADGMAEIREGWPLPELAGAVDMYAPDQAVIFAHGLTYRPRPVFQGYSAYTPQLAELNRRHLAGPNNPDYILFDVAPIDVRFPSLEDGRSWPELLTRYEPAFTSPQYLILKKRPASLEYALEPMSERQVRWGQKVSLDLPADGPIWAEIDVRPNLLGRLLILLCKPGLIRLDLHTRDGRLSSYRLVPGMARSGFLLSPIVRTRRNFRLLYSDAGLKQLQGQSLDKMTLEGAQVNSRPQGYQDQFTLRLFRLKYERR